MGKINHPIDIITKSKEASWSPLHGNLRNNLLLATGLIITHYSTVKYPLDPLDLAISYAAETARSVAIGSMLLGIVKDGKEVLSFGIDLFKKRINYSRNPQNESNRVLYENAGNEFKFVLFNAIRNLGINSLPTVAAFGMLVADQVVPDYQYEIELNLPVPEVLPTPELSL